MEGVRAAAPLLLRDALRETGLQDDCESVRLFRYLWRAARHELLLLPAGSCTAALDAFVRRLDQNDGERARWQQYLGDAAARAAADAEPPLELLVALGATRLHGNWELLDYVWARGPPEAVLGLPRKCRTELCAWLEDRAGLRCSSGKTRQHRAPQAARTRSGWLRCCACARRTRLRWRTDTAPAWRA